MILVTGATGLIGRAVVRVLAESGLSVRAQVRSRAKSNMLSAWSQSEKTSSAVKALPSPRRSHSSAVLLRAPVELVELDFETASPEEYRKLVDGCHAVIHTAGLVHNANASNDAFERLNTRATALLVEAANETAAADFIFFSTSAVYGAGFESVDESQPLQPLTAYAASKIACENLLRQQCRAAKIVILRPSLVFGEGDRGNMLSLIRQINKGLYVDIAGNAASKSIICAEDAALAVQLCLQHAPPGGHLLNLANPEPVGVLQLSQAIARVLGRKAPPVVPERVLSVAAMIAEKLVGARSPLTKERLNKLTTSTTLNVNQLVSLTGFAPRFQLGDSLALEIAWARENGAL